MTEDKDLLLRKWKSKYEQYQQVHDKLSRKMNNLDRFRTPFLIEDIILPNKKSSAGILGLG